MSERKVFRELTDVEEARSIFYQHIPKRKKTTEKIHLFQALGRILAQDEISPIDVPPFDRAAMDGFAVKAVDTTGSNETESIKLDVVGAIGAGYVYDGVVDEECCVEISTGAPMPAGTNAVVMVEYANRKDNIVEIYRSATPGLNVMSAGADIQQGERVLQGGVILTSRELSVLAAMGHSEVEVLSKPKIGIFSSGDEIIPPGGELLPGKLYDINSTAIMTGIQENGGEPIYLGIVRDDYQELKNKLSIALPDYDLLIISGGTSAGMGDMIYTIIDELGSPGLLVHGIKVKPGKPTILAVCNGTSVIGLPGYPASAMSIFRLFVVPYIRQMAGLPVHSPTDEVKATVKQRIRSVMGRYEFKPMNLVKTKTGWLTFPVPGGSGAITSIALADGFIEIPTDASFIEPDTEVTVSLFSQFITPVDLQIIGSHCVALAQIQKLISSKYPDITTRAIAVGSSGGVSAIRRGEAHIAGVHVLDVDKGYNSWDEDQLDAIVIPGYYRMQGLIVKKGNPKKIFGLKDLLKKGVSFMNRNPGSGTRILFDLLITKIGIDPSSIEGYTNFTRSHNTAAQVVRNGLVDVSIGVENVAIDGLDFIPLREEEYDFLIHKSYLDLSAVKNFLSVLESAELREIIESLPGYRLKT